MKFIYSILVLTFCSSLLAGRDFPMGPDPRLTPGSLCDRPSEIRYPERIAYCEREVEPRLKGDVYREYQRQLGYTLSERNRADYKIDHFIPLCAGGSNYENNLWPQHKSIYTQTDGLEELGCKKLSLGKIRQAELVSLFKQLKRNLSLVPEIKRKLESL